MNKVLEKELRTVVGGASKYVYCPICGYKYKTSILERIFRSNRVVQGYLTATHGYLKNYTKGPAYSNSKAVHR